ncbi:hypothetical protein CBM2592_B100345 [Cupriavidus taiwanensis]|nr:hypothetical protein CBM2592_B100345 [Cupriavidus taiwanensis]SOY63040.1 hypothetical protein CBM2588_B130008 [Cupriavidus taiwanensis]SOY98132.1 hypothetical protein CBM2591_B80347 [Cupriavidus taiwanensis]SOZ85169.1 hypothetical protein CBM2618_B130023 [Cupriavidus taiwanensis]SOZ88624.1 hypothetical protein CBM2622_B140025 [Cupriavidus taiwanensis]
MLLELGSQNPYCQLLCNGSEHNGNIYARLSDHFAQRNGMAVLKESREH